MRAKQKVFVDLKCEFCNINETGTIKKINLMRKFKYCPHC